MINKNNGYEYNLGYEKEGIKYAIDIKDELKSLKISSTSHPLLAISEFTTKFDSEQDLKKFLKELGYEVPKDKLFIFQSKAGKDNNVIYDVLYKKGKRYLSVESLLRKFNSSKNRIDFYILLSEYLTKLVRRENGNYYGIEDITNYFENMTRELKGDLSREKECLSFFNKNNVQLIRKAYYVIFIKLLGKNPTIRIIYDFATLFSNIDLKNEELLNRLNDLDLSEEDDKKFKAIQNKYNSCQLKNKVGLGFYMKYGYDHIFDKYFNQYFGATFFDNSYNELNICPKKR